MFMEINNIKNSSRISRWYSSVVFALWFITICRLVVVLGAGIVV